MNKQIKELVKDGISIIQVYKTTAGLVVDSRPNVIVDDYFTTAVVLVQTLVKHGLSLDDMLQQMRSFIANGQVEKINEKVN